MEYITGGTLLD